MKIAKSISHGPNSNKLWDITKQFGTCALFSWAGKKVFIEKLGSTVSNSQVAAFATAGVATYNITDAAAAKGLGKTYTKNGFVKVILQALAFFAVAYTITNPKLGRFAINVTPKQGFAFMGVSGLALTVLGFGDRNGSSSAKRRTQYRTYETVAQHSSFTAKMTPKAIAAAFLRRGIK